METKSVFLENREHGDMLLPVSVYDSIKEGRLPYIKAHWHKEAEVTLVLEGEVIFNVNKNTYHAKKGDVIIISPYNMHSAKVINPLEGFALTIVFDLSMFKSSSQFGISYKYIDPILEGKRDITLFIPKSENSVIFSDIVKRISNLFAEKAFGYELEINSELLKFIYHMYRKYEDKYQNKKINDGKNVKGMKDVIGYINEHYYEKIIIKQLASIANYSESYFMHYFKEITNLSVMDYIIKIRLVKALKLLKETKLSIIEISGMVGFNSAPYFTKVFKRQFKITPIEYRKDIKISNE
ncbi:MAG: AraC family transcriptional regulator [Clostridium sp.]|nr:AraC family transcriptional regulator [Clostridium sp.]